MLQREATQQNINLIYKLLQFLNFELRKSKKLYLRYGFIEIVFLFVCPLADKTRANQETTKLTGVIRHLLASEVLQYFCPPSVDANKLVTVRRDTERNQKLSNDELKEN